MKKIIALLLILTLALSVFVSCGDDESTEKDYSLAIGVSLTAEGAKVSNTVAAIVTDSDGKIVLCRIDAIDVEPTLKDGKLESATYKSKAELGDDYNMVAFGGAMAEWYIQAKAVENFVVGKTQSEVAAIAVDGEDKPTDADLAASCTIGISEFKKAIDKAFASERKVSFKSASSLTAGVAVTANAALTEAELSYTADFSATVFADGKIVAAVIDSNEAAATVKDNKIGTVSYEMTKLEKGDSYGMVNHGGAIAEWYAQAQAFANTAVGKSASELAALATEGVAGCTMYAGGYKAVLEKAAGYTR